MTKSSKKVQSKAEIELIHDAWPRFERFIRNIAKAGPQHRRTGKSRQTKAAERPGIRKAKSQP